MEHLYEKALESAEYIKTHTKKRPYEVGAFIYQVINILNFLSLGNEYLSCITDI